MGIRKWTRRAALAAAGGLAAAATAHIGARALNFDARQATTGPVRSLWIGAVTETSVTACVVTNGLRTPIRLAASKTIDFRNAVVSEQDVPHIGYFFCRGTIDDLEPDTSYYLGVHIGDEDEPSFYGRFRTFARGAHSFHFAAASCARTGSTSLIFRRIMDARPLFFMHMGDLHYENIDVNDEEKYHQAYDEVFDSRIQGVCWRNVPMFYMWDDHDYGENNTGLNSVSRSAAIMAYRRRVPSPPLARRGQKDPIYYSFDCGRLRFVVSDTRSARSAKQAPDDQQKTVLGQAQIDWFQRQLIEARAAEQVIIWVNSVPWISDPSASLDRWGDYSSERTLLIDTIRKERMQRSVAILSGDMHALAYDDGSNSPGGFPVMHAAPLDRTSSEKGGPYTIGPITSSESQYALIEVTDSGGDEVRIRFRGISVDQATGVETVVFEPEFALAVGRLRLPSVRRAAR